MSDTKLVPLKDLHPEKPQEHPKPTEMAQVEAAAISKFAQASQMELTEHEKEVLSRPIPVNELLLRPCRTHQNAAKAECPVCQLYLDWGYYANTLDDAFGKGAWCLSPAPWSPKLYREGNITYREYVLWIRGKYVGNAVGHHEEFRTTANFGDAAEATYANALTRCCKRLGIARDLWRKSKIDEFRTQIARGKSNSTPSVRHEAQPSPAAPVPAAPVTDPIFIECKDMIERASTLDELKAAWDYYNRVKDSLSSAARARLFEQKNQRKTAIEEQS